MYLQDYKGVKNTLLRLSQFMFKICPTAESQVRVCKLCKSEENSISYIRCWLKYS